MRIRSIATIFIAISAGFVSADNLIHINCESNVFTAELLQSDGNAFNKTALTGSATNHAAQDKWFTGDFNGDGADDVARVYSNGVNAACQVFMVNAGGTAFNRTNWFSGTYAYSADARWYPGDFDGDGRSDLIKLYRQEGSFSADVYRSTGSGFSRSA